MAMSKDILNVPHGHYLVHLKTAVIESSEHFGLAQHTFAPLVDIIIEATGEHETRPNALVEEIKAIDKPVESCRIAFENLLLDILLRPVAADVPSFVGQFLIDDTEPSVYTLGVVEQRQVHDGIVLIIRYLQESKAVPVADDFRLS